jgi:hypothetical protein
VARFDDARVPVPCEKPCGVQADNTAAGRAAESGGIILQMWVAAFDLAADEALATETSEPAASGAHP